MEEIKYRPIGVFHCPQTQPVESPRQAVLGSESLGRVELSPEMPAETLHDLQGFSRVWLIYAFHQNQTWKPMVRPPRGSERKRGVFATRSPYRPNSLGMSCVQLLKVEGRTLFCSEHDLLDQTPILDIKPYLVMADSFPEATQGWLSDLQSFEVQFSTLAEEQCLWLTPRLGVPLKQIVTQQLSVEPTNKKIKRVKKNDSNYSFHYRTWRFDFAMEGSKVLVLGAISNYSKDDLQDTIDPYSDKSLHREFLVQFKK